MYVTDIKSIREYYKQLKKARAVLTYEEFSERLGYNRTYISRVLNGHEPLTDEILQKINQTLISETQNVPRETKSVQIKDKNLETEARLLRIEAHLEVFQVAIAGMKAKTDQDFSERFSKLQGLIEEAVKRRAQL